MDLALSICNELKRPFDDKRVRFVFYPNSNDIHEPFLVISEKETVEIVCFKRTVLQIFLECHKMFYRRDKLQQEDRYIMCIGLLLTTTENRTVLNLYRDILQRLSTEQLNEEIRIIERMLCSNNPRLNKSSSLWELYRQIFAENRETCEFNVWNTITLSCEQHFANYYCCYFLRWYSDQLEENDRTILIQNLYGFAKRHMSDVSIWSALSYIIDDKYIEELVQFIEFLPVTSWCPFIPILEYGYKNPKFAERLKNQWTKTDVILENGSLMIPETIEKDLRALTEYKHNGYTTLLLCKLDQLC